MRWKSLQEVGIGGPLPCECQIGIKMTELPTSTTEESWIEFPDQNLKKDQGERERFARNDRDERGWKRGQAVKGRGDERGEVEVKASQIRGLLGSLRGSRQVVSL
jgi:hypothetical protein